MRTSLCPHQSLDRTNSTLTPKRRETHTEFRLTCRTVPPPPSPIHYLATSPRVGSGCQNKLPEGITSWNDAIARVGGRVARAGRATCLKKPCQKSTIQSNPTRPDSTHGAFQNPWDRLVWGEGPPGGIRPFAENPTPGYQKKQIVEWTGSTRRSSGRM